MNPFSFNNKLGLKLLSHIQGYNHKKYWKRWAIVTSPDSKVPLLIKLYYLFWIKRVDSRKLCSFGTNLNSGAKFRTPPNLPHDPNGIIVGHDLIIGSNVTQLQQIVDHPQLIGEYAEKAYHCGVMNHTKEKIQKQISDKFHEVITHSL